MVAISTSMSLHQVWLLPPSCNSDILSVAVGFAFAKVLVHKNDELATGIFSSNRGSAMYVVMIRC